MVSIATLTDCGEPTIRQLQGCRRPTGISSFTTTQCEYTGCPSGSYWRTNKVYAPPPLIETEVFASVPTKLRRKGYQSEWTHIMRHDAPTDCFLEGPSFDRDGNLF